MEKIIRSLESMQEWIERRELKISELENEISRLQSALEPIREFWKDVGTLPEPHSTNFRLMYRAISQCMELLEKK